jgi:hypothetical protein
LGTVLRKFGFFNVEVHELVHESAPSGSASAVLDRMREALSVNTDAALGEKLGVAPTTISNWRKRNTIPYKQVIEVSLRQFTSIKWLITGIGERGTSFTSRGLVDYDILQRVIISVEENEEELRRRGMISVPLKAHYICTIYHLCISHFEGLQETGKLTRDEAMAALESTLPKFFEIYSMSQ